MQLDNKQSPQVATFKCHKSPSYPNSNAMQPFLGTNQYHGQGPPRPAQAHCSTEVAV